MARLRKKKDVVVMGASLGGIFALNELIGRLPFGRNPITGR